ncbi:hypothetical protein ERO13_D03G014601v2 [Gossypium hirsutum]|nr:hypothetical protein ERO13_D03G014601v2 [Gossypium hirsutum]
MIKSVMVMNTQGKPRLAKFFDYLPVEKQQELIRRVFGVLCSRPENVSNFIEAELDSRLVYNHFATLYFVVVFDILGQQTLERCFKNVCELDIVFNYSKIHTILDEIILGGQVLETRSTEIMRAVEEISKLEAATNAISFIPKSASSWLSR